MNVRRAALCAAVAVLVAALGACSSPSSDGAVKPSQRASEAPSEASQGEASETPTEPFAVPTLAPGESAEVQGEVTTWRITVEDVKYVEDDTFEAEGEFVRLGLVVENVGQAAEEFSASRSMFWGEGATAEQEVVAFSDPDGLDVEATYKPGQAVSGGLVLDVPKRGGEVWHGDLMWFVELPA